ncbi:MAG: ATP-binding protein [Candidatus Delongbacteria bacterium]|nr:ATP-binding protein [Candidatus Delongbacteria bacterium]
MKIAIASGKGGTGKTSIAVALTMACTQPVTLLDCDVEEPNAHFFTGFPQTESESITVPIPEPIADRCTGCMTCSSVCQFNAIIVLNRTVVVFPELCHSCGGCTLACPHQALQEIPHVIGTITTAVSGHRQLLQGTLTIGRAMSPPLIHALKKRIDPQRLSILDCPPGTSCPMIAAVKDTDYVILVTEPTPFGLYDLDLAVQTVRQLRIPFGIVINRSNTGDTMIESYTQKESIEILMKIPEERRIAEAYSTGHTILSVLPERTGEFIQMLETIQTGLKGRRS